MIHRIADAAAAHMLVVFTSFAFAAAPGAGPGVRAGAGAAGATAGAGAAAAAESEWPCFRGPNHDGKSPDKGLLKQWPDGGPKLLWKFSGLGKGFSSVSISGSTAYTTGDADGKLWVYAIDIDGGKLKWRENNGPSWDQNHPGARSTPTLDSGKLYVLSGQGVLGCYDAKAGKRLWFKEMKQFGGSPGGWGYAESVLVAGNMAICKPGGRNCILAFNKTTGQGIWSSTGFNAGPEYSSCLPVVHDKSALIVTGTAGGLIAVNANTGALAWGHDFSAKNTANCPTPAYADGYVFWANGYGKGGICMKLGAGGRATEAWRTNDMDCHHGGYIIHEGYIYGSNGGNVTCLDLKTGDKKWSNRGVGKGAVCWADDMLYLFSENGGQAALATCSPQGLEIKGRVKVDGEGPSWAHPAIAGGKLYLRYDTTLYCFDIKGR